MDISRRGFFTFVAGASGAAATGLSVQATAVAPPAKASAAKAPLVEGWDYATVRWFNRVRRFGFLSRGNGKEEVMVHISDLPTGTMLDLKVGQKFYVHFSNARHGYLRATRIYSV